MEKRKVTIPAKKEQKPMAKKPTEPVKKKKQYRTSKREYRNDEWPTNSE